MSGTGSVCEVRGLDAGYGDFHALFGVDLAVAERELLCLVGANGAGKSTLLRAVAGALRPFAGTIHLDGVDITALPDFERARRGLTLVPEGRKLFPSLTVEENLLVGSGSRRSGPWDLDAVYELLPLVAERRARGSARLSGGEQQAVAIGRALMSNPRVLLLDEVSLGLAPVVVERLYESLPGIRAAGTTVVLVEQDLGRTLDVADRVVCLLEGRVVLTGRPADLSREAITDAYFGHTNPQPSQAGPS